MKILKKLLLIIVLLLAGCANDLSHPKVYDDLSKVRIGILQLVQHPALDEAYQGFVDTLIEAGIQEKNIDYQNASGEPSNCQTIAEKFVNNGTDLIYAIATDSVQAAANKTMIIPIVGSAITNFETTGVVDSNQFPNTNVTGASDLNPIKEQIELLHLLVPNAKKIAIYHSSDEANSIYQGKIALEAAKKIGLNPEIVTVPNDSSAIKQVTESLIGKYDAVYIPTDNLLSSNMAIVGQILNENHIPSIVGEKELCKNGGLASLSIDYYTIGQIAGNQAISILKGKTKVNEMPIQTIPAKDCQYYINVGVAKNLGIDIPKDINFQKIGE